MGIQRHRKVDFLSWWLLQIFFVALLSVNSVTPETHAEVTHNASNLSTTKEFNSSVLELHPLHDKGANITNKINSVLKPGDKTLSSHQPPDKEEQGPPIVLKVEKCLPRKKTKKVLNGTIATHKNAEKEKNEGEQTDMMTTCVTPHDDDDITVVPGNVTRHIKCSEESKDKNNCPPKVFPHGNNVKNIQDADEATKARLNIIRYDSSPEMENVTNVTTTIATATVSKATSTIGTTHITTETSRTDQEQHTNQSELLSSSTVSSIKLQNVVRTAELESSGGSSKIINKIAEKGTPTSVVALIITITIAIILVVGYLGMVAWRRYLEYRYGHRELLVNDLEFDTNDLRHFEL